MSDKPQFTLFSHNQGPNGWKVAYVFEELGLTYDTKFLDFHKGEQKEESFTKHNPNGRIPAIIDHKNNDFTLWESCAILEYLADKYDTKHALSFTDESDKYRVRQWLYFQASGQGPYFGQLGWFKFFHSEKIPSAIERYSKEVKRVLQVVEDVLKKPEQKGYLVGGRISIADISFLPWFMGVEKFLLPGEISLEKEYPHFHKWLGSILSRPAIQKVNAQRFPAETSEEKK